MNRVQRKYDGKRPFTGRAKRGYAVLICLLLLGASLAASRMMSEQTTSPLPQQQRENGGVLTETDPENISKVTIALRNQAPWTMERISGGNWRLEGETEWTVDPRVAERITDALSCLEYTECFSEDPNAYADQPEIFGLEPPLVTVSWETSEGQQLSVRIGDPVLPEEADVHYLLEEGNPRLYGVDAGTVQDLSAERALLRDVPELSVRTALLDRITVVGRTGDTIAEWMLAGNVTDQDAGTNWVISEPFRYPADEEAIKKLKETSGNLLLGTWIGTATEERLASCGLTEPGKVLELHMAGGTTGTVTESGVYDVTDWEAETIRIEIGHARDEMTVYVRTGDDVYTMTKFTVEAITEISPLDTAARYPVLTPLNSLVSLQTERNEERHTYERTEEITDDGETVTRWLKDGDFLPAEVFEAAYNRLLTVTVSGLLPGETTSAAMQHTKYAFRTVSGGTHTVELSDYDGLHDIVTVDGHALFYLIKNGMTELP